MEDSFCGKSPPHCFVFIYVNCLYNGISQQEYSRGAIRYDTFSLCGTVHFRVVKHLWIYQLNSNVSLRHRDNLKAPGHFWMPQRKFWPRLRTTGDSLVSLRVSWTQQFWLLVWFVNKCKLSFFKIQLKVRPSKNAKQIWNRLGDFLSSELLNFDKSEFADFFSAP